MLAHHHVRLFNNRVTLRRQKRDVTINLKLVQVIAFDAICFEVTDAPVVTVDSLNETTRTSHQTHTTQSRITVTEPCLQYVSEWSVSRLLTLHATAAGLDEVPAWFLRSAFKALDTLHATATGLDGVPAWFLRLGAPVFALPLAQLLNLSISTSTIPACWWRRRSVVGSDLAHCSTCYQARTHAVRKAD